MNGRKAMGLFHALNPGVWVPPMKRRPLGCRVPPRADVHRQAAPGCDWRAEPSPSTTDPICVTQRDSPVGSHTVSESPESREKKYVETVFPIVFQNV